MSRPSVIGDWQFVIGEDFPRPQATFVIPFSFPAAHPPKRPKATGWRRGTPSRFLLWISFAEPRLKCGIAARAGGTWENVGFSELLPLMAGDMSKVSAGSRARWVGPPVVPQNERGKSPIGRQRHYGAVELPGVGQQVYVNDVVEVLPKHNSGDSKKNQEQRPRLGQVCLNCGR